MNRCGFSWLLVGVLAVLGGCARYSQPSAAKGDLGVSDLGVSDLGVSDLGVSDLGVSDLGVSDTLQDVAPPDLSLAPTIALPIAIAPQGGWAWEHPMPAGEHLSSAWVLGEDAFVATWGGTSSVL
ncbi:MAG: hypothetical protein JRH20_17380, partial [Deltaproteobacteria bacterium]|nr:hypothetical protein [Deltaproteobacteria bacterium]